MLSRSLLGWFNQVGFGVNPASSIGYVSPPFSLYHSILNRTDWVDVDLLCDISVGSYTLPALPVEFPFAPPSGILACLSSKSLVSYVAVISLVQSSGMLTGLSTSNAVELWLNGDALYGGDLPVPVGIFDSLPTSVVPFVQGACGTVCQQRILFCAAYVVNGQALQCPPGSTGQFNFLLQT
jgi:hypothetical protein